MKKTLFIVLKILLTAATLFASYYALFVTAMLLFSSGINHIITYIGLIVVPSLLLPLIWLKKRKKFLIIRKIKTVMLTNCLNGFYPMRGNTL